MNSTLKGAHMADTTDKNLQLLEQELRFILRRTQGFSTEFERADEIGMAANSALRALTEFRLDHQEGATEEIPDDVPVAA